MVGFSKERIFQVGAFTFYVYASFLSKTSSFLVAMSLGPYTILYRYTTISLIILIQP